MRPTVHVVRKISNGVLGSHSYVAVFVPLMGLFWLGCDVSFDNQCTHSSHCSPGLICDLDRGYCVLAEQADSGSEPDGESDGEVDGGQDQEEDAGDAGSPTCGAGGVPAGWDYIHDTTIDNLDTVGLHDVCFERVTFTGGGPMTAVISLTSAAYNLIFKDCVIATGGGWNGVTINDSNGDIHDITFDGCTFMPQGRMGFECTSRPTDAANGYERIHVINSIFEPQGSEAVSFDGGPNARDCIFSGNLIKGAGTNPAEEWGAGFELNGPSNFTVTNNTFWQTRHSIWNLQRHVTDDCGWVFNGNMLDASNQFQSVPMESDAQAVLTLSVHGGDFQNNIVISAPPGGGAAWMSDSHDMDWRGTTWTDFRGGSYEVPTQADGSSGNLF